MDGNDTAIGVVRRAHAAYNARDREAFLDCLAEDVVWHVAGSHPMAGSYRGRDDVWKGYMGPLWPSPARVSEHDLREHGVHVVATLDAIHNFGDGECRFATVEVCRVEAGLVAERREFVSEEAELDRLFVRGCAAAAGLQPD